MSTNNKVIITCAVTGAIHTPSMSPYLPVTSQEIADAAVGAFEAGAAIIHLHARDPVTGKPDQRPEAFVPFLKDIKARSDAIVNLTTGGSPYMTVQERMQPALGHGIGHSRRLAHERRARARVDDRAAAACQQRRHCMTRAEQVTTQIDFERAIVDRKRHVDGVAVMDERIEIRRVYVNAVEPAVAVHGARD